MKRETTAGQQRVLEFIQQTIRDNGVAPTLQEIAGRFEKSTGAIQTSLKALQAKGYIEIVPRKSRGIRLTELATLQDARSGELRAAVAPLLEESADVPTLFRVAQEKLPAIFGMETGVLWLRDTARRRFLGSRDFGIEPPSVFEFRDQLPVKFPARAEPYWVFDRRNEEENPISALIDRKARSFLLIPISDGPIRLGMLAMASARPRKEPGKDLLEAAQASSGLLATPIRRVSAQYRLQEDVKLNTLLLDLLAELQNADEIYDLMRRIFGIVEKLMPADAMWIAVRKPNGDYEALLETDLDDRDERAFFPVPRRMAREQSQTLPTIGEHRYQLINRSAEELEKVQQTAAPSRGQWHTVGNPNRRSASLLFVPISFGKAFQGAISVQSYRMNAYRYEDAERLLLIGRYIALAIRDARLLASAKKE